MKIAFYAALNGGFIKSADGICHHCFNTIKEGHPLYERVKPFANAFLQNPLTQELNNVRDFWDSLQGVMYVPTRADAVKRTLTQAGAVNAEMRARAQQAARGRALNPAFVPREGDPISRQLPTLFYTSMEFIYMTKVMSYAIGYATERGIEIACVQSIHDGLMFVSSSDIDLDELLAYVNSEIGDLSKESFGLRIATSLTVCEDPEWLQNLGRVDGLDTKASEQGGLWDEEQQRPSSIPKAFLVSFEKRRIASTF